MSDCFQITADYFLITKGLQKKYRDYYWIRKKVSEYLLDYKKGIGLFLDYNGFGLQKKVSDYSWIINPYRQWIVHICISRFSSKSS